MCLSNARQKKQTCLGPMKTFGVVKNIIFSQKKVIMLSELDTVVVKRLIVRFTQCIPLIQPETVMALTET